MYLLLTVVTWKSGNRKIWEFGTWKSGNLEIWEFGDLRPGNPEIWRSGDLEIQKFGVQQIKKKKMKIIKIQIRSAQNVGKVWISRKKTSRPYLGPSEAIFSIDPKNPKIDKKMPILLGGPMGPIHPVWALSPTYHLSP